LVAASLRCGPGLVLFIAPLSFVLCSLLLVALFHVAQSIIGRLRN
jgi:hypothetical protein